MAVLRRSDVITTAGVFGTNGPGRDWAWEASFAPERVGRLELSGRGAHTTLYSNTPSYLFLQPPSSPPPFLAI